MTSFVTPPIEYNPEDVSSASAMIRAYCGWHIAPSITETITLDGKGGKTLFLPSLYVTAISAIEVDGVALAASAYDWSQSGRVDRVNGSWPRKLSSIEVTFTHGYAETPLDVRQFMKQMAESGAGTAPLTRAQVGQVTVTYAAPSPLWAALDPYRRFGVA